MNDVVAALGAYLDTADPGGMVGLYLHGSAVDGLRPDSDIDLPLTLPERRDLVAVLLELSGWRGHADRFPEVAGRRPIELTGLTAGRVSTVPDHAHRDFQFGEWLRAEFVNGIVPAPADDPDVVLLVAAARARHRVLRGAPIEDVLPVVPPARLRDAAIRVIPAVVAGAAGDERNALLTMARILVTVGDGTIVSKAEAAAAVLPSLPPADRELLDRARHGYLHGDDGDWSGDATRVREVVERMAEMAYTCAGSRL